MSDLDDDDGDDDGDDYDDDWSKLALQDDDRISYGFEDRDDNDNSNDVDDPGDGAEQHVAEAFEKGRGAAHPRGRYSYLSSLKEWLKGAKYILHLTFYRCQVLQRSCSALCWKEKGNR